MEKFNIMFVILIDISIKVLDTDRNLSNLIFDKAADLIAERED